MLPATQNTISKFSSHLFWDVRRHELDMELNKPFIIKRVLEYGLINDWILINNFFGLEEITTEVLEFRELEPRALAFIATLSNLPKEKFRCYTTRQLTSPHWNF